MKVKAPFAGHPAASSAWLPAATLSLRGSPESHCKRDTSTTGQTRSPSWPHFQPPHPPSGVRIVHLLLGNSNLSGFSSKMESSNAGIVCKCQIKVWLQRNAAFLLSHWVLFFFAPFFRLKKTSIDSWRTFTRQKQWIRHAGHLHIGNASA